MRCYAIYNEDVGYCQGMNFLAGMLYFTLNDEAIAFAMLSKIISQFRLEGLYMRDVPLLRLQIYKMNRLLAIYLPRLHLHLYNEGINVEYLASSWLLTAFTHILRDRSSPPLLLEAIFDKFLVVYLISNIGWIQSNIKSFIICLRLF